MKKIIAIIAIALLSANASAFTHQQIERCTVMGNLGATIMQARQEGMAMSEMLRRVSGDPLVTAMAQAAYAEPQFQSYEFQKKAITDFRNQMEKLCFDGL